MNFNDDPLFYVPDEPVFAKTILPLPSELPSSTHLVISGFPYDEGTRRNQGRVGGAVAPQKFRFSLERAELFCTKKVNVYDAGDIQSDLPLEVAHVALEDKHYSLLNRSQKTVVFSVGGSNDQSYPNAKALLRTHPKERIAVINLDAHFDVRPLKEGKAHSGSPFRSLLENEAFMQSKSRFIEFGAKGASTSKAHYDYLMGKGALVYWMERDIRRFPVDRAKEHQTQAGQLFQTILMELSEVVQHIFVSFDSDVISSRWMPGVSAPSVVGGLSSQQACEIMKIAGKCKKVRLVDCSEFNPAVESFLSGQLLAEMFHSLALGIGEREKQL